MEEINELIDNENLENEVKELAESVSGNVSNSEFTAKNGLVVGAAVAVGAAGYGLLKFGKKKWSEHKAKKEESKKAMSNIQPDEDDESEE